MKYRATIGIFHAESGQLIACVATLIAETWAEAYDWVMQQLRFHSPSPYKYSIDPV